MQSESGKSGLGNSRSGDSDTASLAGRRSGRGGFAIFSAAILSIVVLMFGSAGFAQESGPDAQEQQPPMPPNAGQPQARAVRLSSVEGAVQLSQGNQILAQQALANTPLFEGTQISTSEDGRAEVQFEDGSVARISPNSALTLGSLAQQGAQMQTDLVLNSGLGYFEIQGNGQMNQVRVHFGSDVATVSGFTVLRVNLDYPPGEIAVFAGNAHIEGGNTLALDLHGGQSVKLDGTGVGTGTGDYVVAETIEPDSWDTWNSDRDQALTAEQSSRTAATSAVPNASNPAWSDLDANGNWYDVPGQGYVWSPYEAASANWDPYGNGSWMWTPQYGYIWVSGEPWGYTPYSSGDWSYYDGFGWGWEPGLGVPWWGGGGFFFNFHNPPFRFHPPHRPVGGPRPGNGAPFRVAGGRYQPYPVITVNRLHETPGAAPLHARNAPITVAGNTVQPLHALAPRPAYENAFAGGGARGNVGAGIGNSGARFGVAQPGVRYGVPSRAYAPVNTYHPPTNSYRPPAYTPHYSAQSHPTYSAPASHSAPAGGGGHVSAGGGAHH